METKKLNELINIRVGSKSMEQYIASMLCEAEKKEVEVEKIRLQNQVLKQWNNHHGQVNASFRVMLRDKEAEIEKKKVAIEILKNAGLYEV